jgi:hypothetical protein
MQRSDSVAASSATAASAAGAASGPVLRANQTYSLFIIYQSLSLDISYFLDGLWSTYRNVMAYNRESPEALLSYREACIITLFSLVTQHTSSIANWMNKILVQHNAGMEFAWPTAKSWIVSDLNIPGYNSNFRKMFFPESLPGDFLSIMQSIDSLAQNAYAIQLQLRMAEFPLRDLQHLVREMASFSNQISVDVFAGSVKKLDSTGIIYSSDVAPKPALEFIAQDLERLRDVDTNDHEALVAGMKRVSSRRDELEARAIKGASIRSAGEPSEAALAIIKERDELKKEEERCERWNKTTSPRSMHKWLEDAGVRASDDEDESSPPSSPAYWALSPDYVPQSPPGSPPPPAAAMEKSKKRRGAAVEEDEDDEPTKAAKPPPPTRRAAAIKARTVLAKSKRSVCSRGPRK